jgi:hypothetical protein
MERPCQAIRRTDVLFSFWGFNLTHQDREVFPPEPPIVEWSGRNGAEEARARRLLARRSGPLPAVKWTVDRFLHTYPVHRNGDVRMEFDPDEAGFSQAGTDQRRAVPVPHEIQALLVTWNLPLAMDSREFS